MFAVVGAVGMCITGCIMELWETAFAGCGKAPAFPCTVNAFSIGVMVCYAHFHGAELFVIIGILTIFFLNQSRGSLYDRSKEVMEICGLHAGNNQGTCLFFQGLSRNSGYFTTSAGNSAGFLQIPQDEQRQKYLLWKFPQAYLRQALWCSCYHGDFLFSNLSRLYIDG